MISFGKESVQFSEDDLRLVLRNLHDGKPPEFVEVHKLDSALHKSDTIIRVTDVTDEYATIEFDKRTECANCWCCRLPKELKWATCGNCPIEHA